MLDPRFTSQVIEINTESALTTKPLPVALQPVRTITGRVTYADTGMPVPHARLAVNGFDQFQIGVGARPIITTADAEGRFLATTGSGDQGTVAAFPPDGQPYLLSGKSIEWSKGEIKRSTDLTLPRGVMLRGKVALAGSGRPVSGAVVTFFTGRRANDEVLTRATTLETAADGLFALPVPSRQGYLIVRGPSDVYVLQAA